MKKILIVDDEANMRKILSMTLNKKGYEVRIADSGKTGLELLRDFSPNIIISDMKMDEMNGLEFLKKVRINYGNIPFCFITAYGTVNSAVEAMKLGAVDYIQKPFEMSILLDIIDSYENKENKDSAIEVIGDSKATNELKKMAIKIAKTDVNTLLLGETGVGKDLFAKFIHENSKRKNKPFIKVDCTAIPKELFESELFGHKKGSFTGAIENRIGKFEAANNGTIFLDEIGTLTLEMQKKFLRVLQERVLVRVGEVEERSIDVRVIAATNVDLEKMVNDGSFRKDLYFRLKNTSLYISPLKNRKEDIDPLIEYFLGIFGARYGAKKTLSNEAKKILTDYELPGNVRELENILEQGYILSDEKSIEKKDIILSNLSNNSEDNVNMNLIDTEKKLILRALEMANNNVSQAARILGINRSKLVYKLEKYGIKI
ncbi:sigma-54-dependent Fis family transcriptional regulator [bacterium]|nr:sigma-54-dependent Fis family transcriptional regulator [bacterium]